MTENPGQAPGAGGQQPDYGGAPVPPPAGPGYDGPPAPGYQPPAAPGYDAPAAPGYDAPAAPGYGAPAAPPAPAPEFQQPPAYQPPPATSGGYQPPAGFQPPAAQAGAPATGGQFGSFDPKSLQSFDPKTVNPLDWAIIGAGLVAFIFSTFDFFTYSLSLSGFSQSASVSAWHGFFAPVAILLALLAALLLAVQLIAKLELPFPVRLVVLAAFSVAALFLLIALFAVPGDTGGANGVFGVKIDKGHGFGYWVSFLAVLVGAGLSAKRFTDSGGKLPGRP